MEGEPQIKVVSLILGVYEDTVMVGGIGLKLLIRVKLKALFPVINTPLFSWVHL